MIRRAVFVVLAVLLAVPVATAATPDFKPEQERLRPADVKLAKKVTLKRTDLGTGWRGVPSDDARDDSLADCEGFDLDLSRFTITGRATSSFGHARGATVASNVEVYATRAQAVGDFVAATTHPMVLGCMRKGLEQDLAAEKLEPGMTMRLSSFRRLAAPRVGERAFRFRAVFALAYAGARIDLFVDGLAFQKGRTIVALVFGNALGPFPNQATIARKVAARMR